jgi:hypothetical protein
MNFTAENAEALLSNLLRENGYTRVPITGKKAFKIISEADIRHNTLQSIDPKIGALPEHDDYISSTITVKDADEMIPKLRPHLSKFGMINKVDSKTLVIKSRVSNLRGILEFLNK